MTTPASTFAAFDADGYERLMGRWSTRLAQPFLDFAGTAPGVLDVRCREVDARDPVVGPARLERHGEVTGAAAEVENALAGCAAGEVEEG